MAIPERLLYLDRITFKTGNHHRDTEVTDPTSVDMCVMEAAAWIAGEPWSDHPSCVDPTIAAFMRSWNDSLPTDEDRTRLFRDLLPLVIGTKSTARAQDRRAFMAADWAIRVYTPAWLRLAGLNEHADVLAGLKELRTIAAFDKAHTGPITAARVAAGAAARVAATGPITAARVAARDAAGAAGVAAGVAAGDAAWDAAWDAAAGVAAREAALVAAGDAARVAAGAAALVAAGAAAWAAAREAALVAAGDAARAAAREAAGEAAREAARDATWDALAPTVAELQASAVELVKRMCAVPS